MKKRCFEFTFLAVVTAAWIGCCMFLSWQTGEGTGKLSLSITRWLMGILSLVGINPAEEVFHMFLRECAHFFVFFVSGVLVCATAEAFLRIKPLGGAFRFIVALLVTAMALFADVPKIWIPGRHLTWSESALNAAGALAGYVLTLALVALLRRRGRKLAKSAENS